MKVLDDKIDTSDEACAVVCMIVSNPQGKFQTTGWQKRVNDLIRALRDERNTAHRERDEMKERWTCFHCGEVFTDKAEARAHFGDSEMDFTGCQLNATEGGILKLYREAVQELTRFRQEDNASFREFYALGADHSVALRREEERGYERGLADGRALSTAPESKSPKGSGGA
jgi:hypothetical protein